MLEELTTIKNAQQCRGYDIDRVNPLLRVFRVFPLMVPLVLIALRRAGTIALALDLRAFGARPDRTFFVEVQRGARMSVSGRPRWRRPPSCSAR